MAFWGKILKSGEPYTLHSDGGSRRLRLTQATLVDIPGRCLQPVFRSLVCCTVGNGESIVLCRLQPTRKSYQCSLNLELEESEDVVFSLDGYRPIHLAGYFIRPPMTTINTTTTCSCKAPSDGKQADIEKFRRDDCSNNDPSDTFIAGSSIPENLPPIGATARVEEFDTDKRIDGKQVGEGLVNSPDASQLQLICTEKNSEVEKFELLVESPEIGELLESDLIKDDDKEPHKIDVVIRDENTKGIINVIDVRTENEEIQPDTIEINNVIAAMTENEEIQPDTIEICNFNAAMTESGGIAPDSEDNPDYVAGNASSGNHVLLKKQKIKKSIVEHNKVMFESIETNMKEESNMYTVGFIQKDSLPNDSDSERIALTEAQPQCQLKRPIQSTVYNSSNSLMPSIELGLEVTQNLKLKKRKKKGVKKNKLVTSVVACNSNQGDIFGCNNDDGSHSNEFLSASIMTDQDHNSHVPSTVFNAGISVKLKKKNKKGGFKESKMVVDNVKDNQNQLVDETNNIICGKDENARFKDNGDNADKLQEYSPPNCEKDLSVLKESKKIEKVKVQACKIQDKSINNDSISQDIVLAPTPSLDLKSKLHNEKQVVDSSVPKEKGKQKKRKLMTNKIYDKSTPTETITVLAVPAYSENSKPVADTSALKEKGKLKKRKLETSRVPENPL